MRRHLLVVVILVSACLSLVVVSRSLADQSQTEQNVDIAELASRLYETFEIVLTNHLQPPTLQQMVQESIAAAYASAGKNVPVGLAKEISTSSANSLAQLLERELTKLVGNELEYSDCIPRGFSSLNVDATRSDAQLVNDQIAANRYVGIGIAIMQRPDKLVMSKIFPGGPADLAGAHEKDTVVEVDGKSTTGVELAQVIEWIRGVKGSQVNLVVRRDDRLESLKMTRDVVPFASVQAAVFSKSGKTAGIKLDRISASNVHELRKIAAELDPKVTSVVVDLRTTTGADNLHYGELLGNALLDGVSIGFVADREGKRREMISEPGSIFNGRTLIAVIDARTSGVLKWIAAAFQDSGQAIIYGDPAAVPAVTSTTYQLADGSYSITMPTHVLGRADGQPLARHGSGFTVVTGQNFLPMRIGLGSAGESRRSRLPGTLHPDQAFPELTNAQRANQAVVDPRMNRIYQLKPMLDAIEQAADAVRKSRKKT